MNKPARQNYILFLVLLALSACRAPSSSTEAPLFTRLLGQDTGLMFNNEIARFENDTLNAQRYDPIYNGAGVGIGDFNRDGLSDVFMAGNVVSSRLYLNEGIPNTDLKFKDVTEQAGVKTTRWCTGVSVADVNQDGWPDIYLCVAGMDTSRWGNLLFINEGTKPGGIPHFREMAAAYGLADKGFNNQAAFFDYDRDGDLDCYLLRNAVELTGRNNIRPKRLNGEGPSTDRLYRNEGRKGETEKRSREEGRKGGEFLSSSVPPSSSTPHFKDVSREAGITAEGYGLGLCVTDINQDGWPDVYCANDFISNETVWINNGNRAGRHAGFTDGAAALFKHTSYNAMGVDVQDVNNDGLQDVMVVDMLPENNERQKMMLIKTNWEFFHLARQQGYQDEYVRNTLQLNLGKAPPAPEGGTTSSPRKAPPSGRSDGSGGGASLPVFSEIGQLSGVFRTDWSWAPLLADFDLDAYRDLVVTNGYRRDITNLDYIVYLNGQSSSYGLTSNAMKRKESLQKLYQLPENKLHNYVFRNRGGDQPGDLTFEDKSLAWGLDEETYSNGAAYADLDNDGDLDLIFNNIDGEAGLYRNNRIGATGATGVKPVVPHWLRVKLQGEVPNRDGLGATLRLATPDGQILVQEAYPVRGYLSSVEPVWHFGLGKADRATATITWPNGKRQTVPNLPANRLHTIRYQPDKVKDVPSAPPLVPFFQTLDGGSRGLVYRHEETEFQDFTRTALLPHVFSKNSPGLAVADANGDGLDDVFIGADPGRTRKLYLQKKDGTFTEKVQGANDLEDMGALFLDADADGDPDLYVVSGGSIHEGDRPEYQDRLYVNDGKGGLVRSQGLLPPITSSGGCVVAADFDRDGDLDLFRGGRVQPGSYPQIPRSYLLRNDGGRYTDVTPEVLQRPGLVCAALWTDYDNDNWPDLLLAGEWMPLTFFKNEKGRFIQNSDGRRFAFIIQHSTGWWNSLAAADFDHDGDTDYLAGNLGLNSKYKASVEQPVRLYAGDFDGNGRIDPVMTYFLENKESLVPIRDVITDQMNVMRKRFTSYTDYARASIQDVLGEQSDQAQVLVADQMQSCYLENKGAGNFALRPLPQAAQVSPVFGMQTGDFNGDGDTDALLVGNSYAPETYSGWYDAGRGTLLLGDGRGGFKPVSFGQAGLNAEFDAKALARVQTAKGPLFLVSNNNGPVQFLQPRFQAKKTIQLAPTDAYALVTHADGRRERVEFHHGSGYLSQSSRVLDVPVGAKQVQVFGSRGPRRVK